MGYMVFLEVALVIHRSATQKTVAPMLCKAELNGVVLCVKDILYAKNLIELIGMKVEFSIKLEINSKGAVDLISSFSVGGCTRHVNVNSLSAKPFLAGEKLVAMYSVST